ncbi:MAG: hypothetical protein AAF352_00005 [Pseudomonadota bacterium]
MNDQSNAHDGIYALACNAVAKKAYLHALTLLLRAVKRDPHDADVHALLAGVYGFLGQWQAYGQHAEIAASHGLKNPIIHKARAFRFWQKKQYDQARLQVQEAFALFPDDKDFLPQILNFRLHENLSQATYQKFLADYPQATNHLSHMKNAQHWRGAAIADNSLLIRGEGWFGDVIMLVRFLSLIRKLGLCHGPIHIIVQPELIALFERSFPDDFTFQGKEEPTTFPKSKTLYVENLWYLPQAFALSAGESVPYLFSSPAKVEQYRTMLSQTDDCRIALIFCSETPNDPTGYRHMQQVPPQFLEFLRPLAGITWVVMAPKASASARQHLCEMVAGVDVSSHIDDFDDWAALLAHCDAVVAIDTGGAHLAGAMGIPGWVLLRNPACWRWPKENGPSGWYPQIQVLHHDGDWVRIGAELVCQIRKWKRDNAITQPDTPLVDLLNTQQYHQALPQLLEMRAASPDTADIYYWLGFSYHALRAYADALSHYEKALALGMREEKLYIGIGQSHYGLQAWGQLQAIVYKGLEEFPRNRELLKLRFAASLQLSLGRDPFLHLARDLDDEFPISGLPYTVWDGQDILMVKTVFLNKSKILLLIIKNG